MDILRWPSVAVKHAVKTAVKTALKHAVKTAVKTALKQHRHHTHHFIPEAKETALVTGAVVARTRP